MLFPIVKTTARRLAPGIYQRLRSRYNRDARLNRAIIQRQGLVVASGPFAGLRYLDASHGSRLVPKLLGSYELELHDVILDLLAKGLSTVVDVGCAEGYYAVGFARALPDATVFAFDINPVARQLCAKLAALNDLDGRPLIRGACRHEELNGLSLEGALVMCDCEGYELELLQPEKVPGLRNAHLLVELHDFLIPGLTAEILARFESTHKIRLIDINKRKASDYASLENLSTSMQSLALYERDSDCDPPQQWAYMEPK